MFRKITALLIAVFILLAVISCDKNNNNDTDTSANGTSGTASESSSDNTTSGGTSSANSTSDGEEEVEVKSILSTKYLYSLSSKKNVIVFILDRFDVSFYNSIVKEDKDFFKDLDGFTYYGDNVSRYSRTYPAVASMITGFDQDFSKTASEYFTYAYANSDFVRDLKANNYTIGIYTDDYYCYRDASELAPTADNVIKTGNYRVADRDGLVKNMLLLSLYRYSPIILKNIFSVSSGSFSNVVTHDAEYPEYTMDRDSDVFQHIKNEGLTVDVDSNLFLYIHLNGCHPPVHMDADGNYVEEGGTSYDSSVEGTKGCINMIKMYIQQMKDKGVYDDSTIIITGDHCRAINDNVVPTQTRLTALFVKEPGNHGELKYSDAQVSQSNFHAEIIKAAGIETKKDYGTAYSDVPVGVDIERHHYFELSKGSLSYLVDFKVMGTGTDFNNWTEVGRKNIGYMYK